MADNRLYLTCAICGEHLFLGKAFSGNGAFYTNYDGNGTLEEKLNDFYNAHMFHDNGNNLVGTNFFIEHEWHSSRETYALRQLYLAFSQDD